MGVFAVVDWIVVAKKVKQLEFIAKPATMLALISGAVTLLPAREGMRSAFVVALVFSLLGDVLLMLPSDRFIAGVASFALAHVAYIVGFRLDDSSTPALLIGVAGMVVFAMTVGGKVLAGVRARQPEFVAPVSAYIAIISVMVASAIATTNPVAITGALIFMASDTLIAWNRFVRPQTWAPVTIMVTYHVGQLLLVLSLLRS